MTHEITQINPITILLDAPKLVRWTATNEGKQPTSIQRIVQEAIGRIRRKEVRPIAKVTAAYAIDNAFIIRESRQQINLRSFSLTTFF